MLGVPNRSTIAVNDWGYFNRDANQIVRSAGSSVTAFLCRTGAECLTGEEAIGEGAATEGGGRQGCADVEFPIGGSACGTGNGVCASLLPVASELTPLRKPSFTPFPV